MSRPIGLLIAVLFAVPACTSAIDTFSAEGPFEGIAGRLAEKHDPQRPVQLLIVHGMGKHGPAYSDQTTGPLLVRLGLNPANAVIEGSHPIPGTLGQVRIVHQFDEQKRERLVVRELLWEPIVSAVAADRLAFDADPRFSDGRQCLNAKLKKEMITDRLSAPLIYLGSHGADVRAAARSALVEAFAASAGDELCIMTHSMGSVIIFDTLAEMAARGEVPANRRILQFMLANQLELFDLGREDPIDASTAATRDTAAAAIPTTSWLDAVVLCDPNDLLTFQMSDVFKRDHARLGNLGIRYTNVAVSVALESYFGVIANPVDAHIGYLTDPRVLDLMAFGWTPEVHAPPAVGVP